MFLQCIHIEDCEGWWLSGCHGSVAEHWWLKPGVSWFNSQQLLAFSLSSIFASKRLNSFIEPKLHQASLVSCPSARASRRETVWLMKSNFLDLFPRTVEGQWDCEIANYYVALPLQHYSSPFEYPYFFERVFCKMFWMLLGYTVATAPANPRNSTWFTRLFLLVRGWDLGTRLEPVYGLDHTHSLVWMLILADNVKESVKIQVQTL